MRMGVLKQMKYNVKILKSNNFADVELASKFLNKRILVGDDFPSFNCRTVFLDEIRINALKRIFIDHDGNEHDEIAVVDKIEL